jgi:hypothetical protein
MTRTIWLQLKDRVAEYNKALGTALRIRRCGHGSIKVIIPRGDDRPSATERMQDYVLPLWLEGFRIAWKVARETEKPAVPEPEMRDDHRYAVVRLRIRMNEAYGPISTAQVVNDCSYEFVSNTPNAQITETEILADSSDLPEGV